MHCKKCDAVFHLDATGKAVLGEPPSSKKKGTKTTRAANEPLDPIGIVAEKLSHTPKPVWMGMLGILGLVVLYYAYQLFAPAPPTEEMQITQQIITAGRAILAKDLPTIKKMTTSDSQDEIEKAVGVFHAMIGPFEAKPDEVMLVPGPPPQTDEGCVNVTAMLAKPTDIDICWIKGGNRWFVNGKSTLDMMTQRADAAKKAKK